MSHLIVKPSDKNKGKFIIFDKKKGKPVSKPQSDKEAVKEDASKKDKREDKLMKK